MFFGPLHSWTAHIDFFFLTDAMVKIHYKDNLAKRKPANEVLHTCICTDTKKSIATKPVVII